MLNFVFDFSFYLLQAFLFFHIGLNIHMNLIDLPLLFLELVQLYIQDFLKVFLLKQDDCTQNYL